VQHGSNAIRRNLIGVEVTHEINFNVDMNSFFNDFLAKHGATAAQCAVVLHTVSATDSLIISVDPDAARVYVWPPGRICRDSAGVNVRILQSPSSSKNRL
jgi:hypothetical protein